MSGERILVAMSGGVDSSVAAALLAEQGHQLVGATMKTFCYQEEPGPSRTCCGLDGIMDARQVADGLGIAHYVFDVEEEFTRDVIDDFVSEYARGRTPNPCVRCNSNTKFRDLLRRGELLGCDAVASGHYVRAAVVDGETALFRGSDSGKDQSYFLWGLPRDLLPRLRFPLGELTKPEVRAYAHTLGLVTAAKPESQEICFVPTGDYRDLLRGRLGTRHDALRPGNLVDSRGRVVGRHQGYASFTVGQRRGLGGGFDRRLYVIAIHPDRARGDGGDARGTGVPPAARGRTQLANRRGTGGRHARARPTALPSSGRTVPDPPPGQRCGAGTGAPCARGHARAVGGLLRPQPACSRRRTHRRRRRRRKRGYHGPRPPRVECPGSRNSMPCGCAKWPGNSGCAAGRR